MTVLLVVKLLVVCLALHFESELNQFAEPDVCTVVLPNNRDRSSSREVVDTLEHVVTQEHVDSHFVARHALATFGAYSVVVIHLYPAGGYPHVLYLGSLATA